MRCPVCGASNRPINCAQCAGSQAFQDGLAQRRAERDALLQRLDAALAGREVSQAQQLQRWQAQQTLKAARAKAQRAKDALTQAQQQVASLAAATSSRRVVLEQLSQQTAAARTEVLGNTLPTMLRYQALTHSHMRAMLEREQRCRLRELTEIFPLRINAVRHGGGPIHITVCNLRLPEGAAPPPGGWPEPQATSAALGYLLLLADKVGFITGGPMLHESHYNGSSSSIWAPGSFWSRQPPSPAAMLPLHVLGTGGSGGSTSGQAYQATTSRYLATANFWGLPRSDSSGLSGTASLAAGTAAAAAAAAASAASAAAAAFSRATGMDGALYSSSPSGGTQAAAAAAAAAASAAASSSSSGGVSASTSGRREPDFKAAWDLLQRSLACFLKDKAARNGMQLPAAWNPLAWLVVYCAVVKRDSRQDGNLVALCSRDAAAAGGGGGAAGGGLASLDPAAAATLAALGDSSLATGGSQGPGLGLDALEQHGGGGEDDEEDEGWVVQTPFLPPPPSQPDEVEHWARAMFADGNALAGSAASAAAAAAAAAGQHAGSSLSHYGLSGLTGALAQRGARPGGGGGGGPAVLGSSPGSGGMMSMERVRSLFSK